MENQIDDFFRDRLEIAEAKVSKDVWLRLENRLLQRRIIRKRLYAAAALIVICIVSGFWLWVSSSGQKQILITDQSHPETKEIPSVIKPKNQPYTVSTTQGSIKKSSMSVAIKPPVATMIEEIELQNITEQHSALVDEDVSTLSGDLINSLPEFKTPEPASNISVDQETNLVIYELMSLEETALSSDSNPKLIKVLTEWKREGISLGAVRDLKNDFFNKLNKIRQRTNFHESKFEITEK